MSNRYSKIKIHCASTSPYSSVPLHPKCSIDSLLRLTKVNAKRRDHHYHHHQRPKRCYHRKRTSSSSATEQYSTHTTNAVESYWVWHPNTGVFIIHIWLTNGIFSMQGSTHVVALPLPFYCWNCTQKSSVRSSTIFSCIQDIPFSNVFWTFWC